MSTIIGIIVAVVVLAAIIVAVKLFAKPVEGPLPDCCSGNGNKELNMSRKI